MNYLVLVRHGESRWNVDNKFTGWVDVPLSEKGITEAELCGFKLKNLELDIAYTSNLERAQQTLLIILAHQYFTGYIMHNEDAEDKYKYLPKVIVKEDIPIIVSNDLNERYYGQLQGMDKQKAKRKYGEKKVYLWRRSFHHRPPGGESLADTYNRVIPFFKKKVMDSVKTGKNVIVAAHGNTLRVVIKYLENIHDSKIPYLELLTGEPIIYKYTRRKLVRISSEFSFDRPIRWGNNK